MSFNFDWMSIIKSFLPVLVSLIPIAFVFGIVFLVIYCFKNKVKIKWKTFKSKGFRPIRGDFGLFVYTGAQGKGKTYSLVEYLLDNNKKIKVFSNVSDIKNVDDITYFRGFEGIIKIKEALDNGSLVVPKKKKLVIVYDELFQDFTRGDKLSKPVMDFLSQMRKRKIICLTTAQYWSPIPIDFRRFARYQIDCNMIPFLWGGFLIKVFHDAEQMKWSNDDQDFVAPVTETTITKCRKIVSQSYDTFLRISSKPAQSE